MKFLTTWVVADDDYARRGVFEAACAAGVLEAIVAAEAESRSRPFRVESITHLHVEPLDYGFRNLRRWRG